MDYTYLIDRFAKCVLERREPVPALYNRYIQSLQREDEVKFVSHHMMLFLKSGEAVRNAIPEIQELIRD